MSEDPQTDPERRRIECAREGVRAAQEELLRAHYPAVHATAFRLVGNPEDAEDLAQECLVRALRSLAFYRGEGSFAGWLRRILVHLAQDRFRARRRPEPVPLPADIEDGDSAGRTSGREPHRALESRELAVTLADALAALNAPLRVALLLRTREGLEYEEIAALTGVTSETARTRVMKARKALLRQLGPVLGEDAERAPVRIRRKP